MKLFNTPGSLTRTIRPIFDGLCALMLLFNGCGKIPEVTTGSLLQEMTDREQIARFPHPDYTCKQFSSYNRTSVRAGDYTWFGNLDNNYFIRTEEHQGRREYVLFDADGPGVVVRFWSTFARYDGKGTLRFYFDGESQPGIEAEPMALLSGRKLVPYPLSFSVSPETDISRRGHNLYLPIPYARHLKITYETESIREARDGIHEVADRTQQLYYYQINYRTYSSGVKVKTFDTTDLTTYAPLLKETLNKIGRCDRDLDGVPLSTTSFSGRLLPGSDTTITLNGPQAVRKLQLKLKACNLEQALRSTVITFTFDGQQTVWAPVGDFFATGYTIIPAITWYQQVDADSTLAVFWVMPFKTRGEISLINHGDQEVQIINGEIHSSPWKWDKRSMLFGSSWYQNTRINTGLVKDRDGHGDMFDINYTTLDGKGVYVGDAVTLFNCSPAWWGEGDEKVFVDHEEFPSHFGTGTEDYYGYAWCRPEKFGHPFISQPDGSGNLAPGYTLNMRFRTLDAIPFRESLRFDMELWHWGYTRMNHAPITYWYIMPGGSCGITSDTAAVKEVVVLKREQIFPPVMNEQRIIEGEDLVVTAVTGEGTAVIRPVPVPGKPNWTKACMQWSGARTNDRLSMKFVAGEPGNYTITMNMVAARALPTLKFLLNGKQIAAAVFAPGNENGQRIILHNALLVNGDNELTVIVKSSSQKDGELFGIDFLQFQKL